MTRLLINRRRFLTAAGMPPRRCLLQVVMHSMESCKTEARSVMSWHRRTA